MENNKLDKRTKWSYCIGATGRDMAYALISMFLLTYIQYTMKLTVAQYAVISAIMVVCLLWDAINDPMMGIIIENSHLKAGKFKPWIFIGVILNSLIIICLFTVRPEGWGFVAFFGVGYLLWGMTYTMNDIAYWGMLPSLTSDPGERNWLVTVQGIFICIGQFSVAGLLPDMVAGNAIMAYRTAAIVIAFCFIAGIKAQTQNSMTEIIPFKTIDGKIIIEANINGETANFVLDLAGHNALLPEAVNQLKINTKNASSFGSYQNFKFKQVPVKKIYEIGTLTIGNNTFSNSLPTFILEDEPYLRKLGVMGVLNSAVFRTSVLTIDMRRKKITITQPYRPSYMKLNYRENFELITGLGIVCSISIQDKTIFPILDTWSDGLINLTEKDFNEWSTLYPKGTPQKVSIGYKETAQEEESLTLPETIFVKTKIDDAFAVRNPSLKHSVLGKKLLDYGILSIDYVHQKIYFQPFDLVPIPESEAKVTEVKAEDGKMNPITRQFFLEHIFDYRTGNDFVYNGDKPVVVDFWATWCGPCMRLLPKMEELAEKYKGKVMFYKVNADKEKDLCKHFGVQALPTLFFIPVGGKPIVEVGATPEKYVQIIEEQLLK